MTDPTPEQIAKYRVKAEELVRKNAAPNSLTEKILNGWFGEADKRYLIYKKARELARMGKH